MMRPRTLLLSLAFALAGCADLPRVGAQTEEIPPLPPRATSIDDSIFRPLSVPERDPFGYPGLTVDKREVLALLRSARYEELERFLREQRNLVARDIGYEYHLRDAYLAFHHEDPALEAQLDAWVAARPTSSEALLARGDYYVARAWARRGEKLASETSQEQMEGMRQFAVQAAADARTALAMQPAHPVGYSILLAVLQFGGWSEEHEALLAQALHDHPTSFVLRAEAMNAMEPRWGGSYARMEAFADEAAAYADRNPRLVTLRGFADAERGYTRLLAKDYAGAVHYYTQALAHGEERELLLGRAQAYYQAKDFPRALDDLVRAWRQRPQAPAMLMLKAKTLYQIARALPPAIRGTVLDRAVEDLEVLTAIHPADEDAARWLAFLREQKAACLAGPEPCG